MKSLYLFILTTKNPILKKEKLSSNIIPAKIRYIHDVIIRRSHLPCLLTLIRLCLCTLSVDRTVQPGETIEYKKKFPFSIFIRRQSFTLIFLGTDLISFEFPARFCWLVIYVFIVSINETGEYLAFGISFCAWIIYREFCCHNAINDIIM